MRVLTCEGLDSAGLESQVQRVAEALGRGDFRAARMKKLEGSGFCRAELGRKDRLLVQLRRYRCEIVALLLDRPWLDREAYLGLGVRQSIFPEAQRAKVYDLFEKYLAFLGEARLFEPNIVAHGHLPACQARYDLVALDEVQDLTNVQLALLLRKATIWSKAPPAPRARWSSSGIRRPCGRNWTARPTGPPSSPSWCPGTRTRPRPGCASRRPCCSPSMKPRGWNTRT